MNTDMMKKYELLIDNYNTLKKGFKMELDPPKHLIALCWTQAGRSVDIEEIKSVKDMIKRNSKAFSPFRGQMHLILSGLLSLEEGNIESTFQYLSDSYDILKKAGFKDTIYLPSAALSFVLTANDVDAHIRADKAVAIYKQMKVNHPIITSGDDYSLAISLADANINLDRVEVFYDALKSNGFRKGNGLQSLSHLLALHGGSIDELVRRCVSIKDELKSEKLKIGSEYYSIIGLIAMMYDEVKISDIVELTNMIRKTPGYRLLGKDMCLMLASSLYSNELLESEASELSSVAMKSLVQTIYVAQQVAMISAMVIATTVATSN